MAAIELEYRGIGIKRKGLPNLRKSFVFNGGRGGIRTLKPFGQRILSPPCMPFHHSPEEELLAMKRTI